MKTIQQIQKEVHEWSLKNFGQQPSYRPLLGIVEECLNELQDGEGTRESVVDAIGDATIYCLDYASREGIDIVMIPPVLWRSFAFNFSFMCRDIGKLCHAHLKSEQGIRVIENHREAKIQLLHSILGQLNIMATVIDTSLVEALNTTWETVSKRDWKKNKENGIQA